MIVMVKLDTLKKSLPLSIEDFHKVAVLVSTLLRSTRPHYL